MVKKINKVLEWQLAQQGLYLSDKSKKMTAPIKKEDNTYIGYGIDIIHAFGPGDLKGPLFKDSVYDDTYGQKVIDSAVKNEAKVNSVETDSFLESFTSFEVNAEIRTGKGVPFFSGGFSTHYGDSRRLESTARFYNSIVSYCKSKHTLLPAFRSTENIKKIIQEDVLADINNSKIAPEKLFSCYGTHLIQEANIGGSTQVTAIYNSSTSIEKHALKAAVDFACSYVSVKTDVKFTDEQKKILSSTEIRGFCQGGDATLMAGLVSFTQLPEFLKNWGASLKKPEDLVLAEILKYLPIWELATDKARKKALEDEFFKQAEETGKKVSGYFVKAVASELIAISTMYGKQNPSLSHIGSFPKEKLAPYYPSHPEIVERMTGIAFLGSEEIKTCHKCRKIENEDHTFSFRFDSDNNQFLRVHYISSLKESKGADIQQLYIIGQNIGDREKFILEKSGNGYKMKSVFNGKYVRSYFVALLLGSGNILAADASAADAAIFNFTKL